MLTLFISFILWVVIALTTLLALERIPREFLDGLTFLIKIAALGILFILLIIVISISIKPVWADITALVEFGAKLI